MNIWNTGTVNLNGGTLNLTGDSSFQNAVVAVGDALNGGGTGQITVADGITADFFSDVYADGDGISVGTGGEAVYHGYLSGTGNLGGAGTHTALGGVGPGNSPGTLTVDGDFVFADTASFEVEIAGLIAGDEYDVLDVSGEAWLDGTLSVSFLDGFVAAEGDSFDVLLAEVLHGTFGSSVLPDLGSQLVWQLQYLLDAEGVDTLRLSVQAVPVPAAVWMLLSALGALGYARRRQRLH